MPDYENDLVFKPELSWEELKKEAEKIWKGNIIGCSPEMFGIPLERCTMYFRKSGMIDVEFTIGQENVGGLNIKSKCTYDGMKTIIQALYEE